MDTPLVKGSIPKTGVNRSLEEIIGIALRYEDIPPEGQTMEEIARNTNRGIAACRIAVAKLIADGKIEFVGMVKRPRIDGRIGYKPAYRSVVK